LVAVLPVLAAAWVGAFLFLEGQPRPVEYAVVAALSYLLGSVPWGYLLLRLSTGEDVRDYGSGRTGMTNVLRTGGGKIAAATMALDVAKAMLAVLLARAVIGSTEADVAAGLMVLVGHNWPVFLQFRGGRGILTGLGGILIMAPVPAAIATVTFLIITFASRYVSLGSMIGVTVGCLAMVALTLVGTYSSAYAVYAILGCAIIIWQHRDNIQRIRQGNERRLGNPPQKAG
jgi:glycerol-3-phosphate acyltransferase PlsY